MASKNEIYTSSLVDYINDVKPFHSKLSEVIEYFYFNDSLTVTVEDSYHLTTTLGSSWSKSFVSDGLRTRYLFPPLSLPNYAMSGNIGNFTQDAYQLPDFETDFGILNAYKIPVNQGIDSVVLNSTIAQENIDFFISRGIYSFETNILDGTYRQTNNPDTIFSIDGETFVADFWKNCNFEINTNLIPPVNPGDPEVGVSQIWNIIKINPVIFPLNNSGEPVGPVFIGAPGRFGTKKLKLIVNSYASVTAPAETWEFTFSGVTNTFEAVGSISGVSSSPILIGTWWDNGSIRVKFIADVVDFISGDKIDENALFNETEFNVILEQARYTQFCLDNSLVFDGDKFSFEIAEEQYSYLVHGSDTNEFKLAGVGVPFDNGQIKFTIPKPYYKVNNIAYQEANFVELPGIELLQFPGCYLKFLNNPSPISETERFDFEYKQFNLSGLLNPVAPEVLEVTSSVDGLLPMFPVKSGAISEYSNFEHSSKTIFKGSDFLNIAVVSETNFFQEGDKFTIEVVNGFVDCFHGQDILIAKNPVSNILVKSYYSDTLELSISKQHLELGEGFDDPDLIPIILKPIKRNEGGNYDVGDYDVNPYDFNYGSISDEAYSQPVMPSRKNEFGVFLNSSELRRIGTVTLVFDATIDSYRRVIDFTTEFVKDYLPSNTALKITTNSSRDMNQIVGTSIKEDFLNWERIKLVDTINVNIIETLDCSTTQTSLENSVTSIDDSQLSFLSKLPTFLDGYDEAGYDENPYSFSGIYRAIIFIQMPLPLEMRDTNNDLLSAVDIQKTINGETVFCSWKYYNHDFEKLTVELPPGLNNLILCSDLNDINGSAYIEAPDFTSPIAYYTKTQLPIVGSPNTTFVIEIKPMTDTELTQPFDYYVVAY